MSTPKPKPKPRPKQKADGLQQQEKSTPVRWKPGQSGNPAGRKPGTSEVQRIRDGIRESLPGILQRLTSQALEGDTQAARLLLERTIPPLKPQDPPAPLPMDTAAAWGAQARQVLAAVSRGDVSASTAAGLLGVLDAAAKLSDLDDMKRRMDDFEAALTNFPRQ